MAYKDPDYMKKWRAANRERLLEYAKRYVAEHREQVAAAKRVYKAKNRRRETELAKQSQKRCYARDPEKINAKNTRWLRANPHKYAEYVQARRARVLGGGGKYSTAEWRELKAHYNHTCLRCGKREPEIKLTVDHVVPLILGGSNSIENIQPLCKCCNSKKHVTVIDYRPQAATAEPPQLSLLPLAASTSTDTPAPACCC